MNSLRWTVELRDEHDRIHEFGVYAKDASSAITAAYKRAEEEGHRTASSWELNYVDELV